MKISPGWEWVGRWDNKRQECRTIPHSLTLLQQHPHHTVGPTVENTTANTTTPHSWPHRGKYFCTTGSHASDTQLLIHIAQCRMGTKNDTLICWSKRVTVWCRTVLNHVQPGTLESFCHLWRTKYKSMPFIELSYCLACVQYEAMVNIP